MSTDIEPVNGHHDAPDEPVARVIALAEQGYSARHAGELVGISERQAQRWVKRSRELTGETNSILDKWKRRSLQALDIIGDGLDLIEEDDTRQLALKNLQTLNIIAGTGTDKLQKDTTPPVQAQNVLIVVNAARPGVIEGEIVESDAAQGS